MYFFIGELQFFIDVLYKNDFSRKIPKKVVATSFFFNFFFQIVLKGTKQ